MASQVTIQTSERGAKQVYIDKLPDECPWCHKGIDSQLLFGYLNTPGKSLHLSFSCPRIDCRSYFIARYFETNTGLFTFMATLLGQALKKQFSVAISGISPAFVKIYYQSEVAEENLLDQICGPGYRKALEFLVKDYIISRKPSLKESVEKKQLGNCIKDHIENENIKALSKRATWIGNDEVHYVRIWEGKDITDLKSLINLSVHWIDTEILTEELIISMPEVSKTAP